METAGCNKYIGSNGIDVTELPAPAVLALTFRITDMGNGVDRIERAGCLPFDDAVAGTGHPDSEPLPRPTPQRLLHGAMHVLGSIGIKTPDNPELLIEGYSRAVSSHAIDVVAWLPLLA